jgi:hypothetical protein
MDEAELALHLDSERLGTDKLLLTILLDPFLPRPS